MCVKHNCFFLTKSISLINVRLSYEISMKKKFVTVNSYRTCEMGERTPVLDLSNHWGLMVYKLVWHMEVMGGEVSESGMP